MMKASNDRLQVQALQKRYGNKVVLSDLSFSLQPGEVSILLGPNGSGKSTCLAILATQLRADAGLIEYPFPKSYSSAMLRRNIGCLYQKIALIQDATVSENLHFAGRLFGLSKKECQEQILQGLARFEIPELMQASIHALSLGQRRMIDIIRVFMHTPTLLFFDEPTQGLDVRRRQIFWEFLKHYCEEHSAIALNSTHFHEEIPLNTRVLTLQDGKLLSEAYWTTSNEVSVWIT